MVNKKEVKTLEEVFLMNNELDGKCYCPIPQPDNENKFCLTCGGTDFKINKIKKKKK